MLSEGEAPFGTLLRSSRHRAGLTQAELAERAGMSVRAIAALECGERRAPYRDTVAALVEALGSSRAEARELETAATCGRLRPRKPEPHDAPPGNLPLRTTTFVGREPLIDEADASLAARRCVAFVGRGGIGKTRLALVLARRVESRFAHGAWLVDLSSAFDERAVVAKIGSVLSIATSDADALDSIARALASRNVLIVLDNCEAVATACGAIADAILRACPQVSIVATSIVPLGTSAAVELRVAPLAMPDAIDLFAERCERYGGRAGFAEALPAVTSICRRLEGIPLAIELAASRAATLGLSALDSTIEQWFGCSDGAFADVPARHRSLFAAIGWSHDLLSDAERIAFRRLAVFAGGFDLDAAAEVCAAAPLAPASIVGLVTALAEKSLVDVEERDGVRRWALFDSVRTFANAKLSEAGEDALAGGRHAAYFAAYAGDGKRAFYGAMGSAWLRDLRLEEDNLEAALAWHATRGDAATAAFMAGSLRMYWQQFGRLRKAEEVADAVASRLDADRHPSAAAELHLTRALNLRGSHAVGAAERAVALCESGGDPFRLAIARIYYAWSLTVSGRYDEALAVTDSIANGAGTADRPGADLTPRLAWSVHNRRGQALFFAGRLAEARAEYRAAIGIALRSGDAHATLRTELWLGETEFALGDAEGARTLLRQSLERSQGTLDPQNARYALANLAGYALVLGETDAAAGYVAEALELDGYDAFGLADVLQHAAAVLALRGRAADAAALGGYVDEFRRSATYAPSCTEERSKAVLSAALVRQLPEAEIEARAREGAAFGERAAVELARSAASVRLVHSGVPLVPIG